MIPKTIHYCWFGGKNKTKLAKKCIKSWKRKMPDYEIVEWNESNFDVNCNEYVKEAYKHGKWAFVSDYARLYVLYSYGGLYFDTDVRMIKSVDDLVHNGPFLGREQQRDGGMINLGLGMAMDKNNVFLKKIMESYDETNYINGSATIVQRLMRIIDDNNYVIKKANGLEYINDICIYPADYLCPMGYNGLIHKTNNTYCIHLYDGSWLEDEFREDLKNKRLNNRWNIRKKIYYALLDKKKDRI